MDPALPDAIVSAPTEPTMGLTIHYDLQLPATTPRDEVIDRFTRFHEASALLPFARVGPLVTTPEDRSLGRESSLEALVRFWTWLQTDNHRPKTRRDALPDAIGFGIDVGAECEPAVFGVAWVPPKDERLRVVKGAPPSWRWQCATKTQYASNVSEEHFLQCHMSIVAVLDEAARTGFDVTVHDEGNYWESRDVDQLRSHVQDMNHIIAKFAGAIHDRIGHDHRVESPIFARRDFERLEMGATKSQRGDD